MDFGKFRVGGELSDIEVVVDGKLFQLHRFPLYTKSGFFLKEFAKLGIQQAITLKDFPGGEEAFTVIADFCYNISVDITVNNVVGIRCGAKYLEMNGSGNLLEKTGIIIEGIANNARRGKDLEKLLKLLSTIATYQHDETTHHTLEQCTSALVHHWNKCQYGTVAVEEVSKHEIQSIFFDMNLEFFIKLMQSCKEKIKNGDVLHVLISEYINHIIDSDSRINRSKSQECSSSSTTDDEGSQCGISNGHSDDSSKPVNGRHTSSDGMTRLKQVQRLISSIQPNLSPSGSKIGRWLKPLLETYSHIEGSNEILGSIAAAMVNQIDSECISAMDQQTLFSFAENVKSEEVSDPIKRLFINHLVEESDKGLLNVHGLIQMIKSLDLQTTPWQDSLIYIIATLNAKDCLDESELNDCVSMIQMSKCTVKGLRHAYTAGKLPPRLIVDSVLDLCDTLQEKVDVSTKIIQEQEKEISTLSLQTFGMLHVETSPKRAFKQERALSHSTIGLYTSSLGLDVSSPRNGENSTAGLGRALDGIWSDRSANTNNTQEPSPNSKLSELLRKQRQNKLWK